MLLAVAALTMPLGWIAREWSIVRERQEISRRFDDGSPFKQVALHPADTLHDVPWLRRFLGDEPWRSLMYAPEHDPDGSQFRRVRELFPEATIWGWPLGKAPLPAGIKRLDQNRWIMY
ncbi:MAG TPA: hypothetical protein VGJ26_13535, partial [Pirellulales bacterium]